MKDLFVEGGDEKDDNELYTLDDKSDGEMLVIEEEGGGVGLAAGEPPRAGDGEDDPDGDPDPDAYASDKGDDVEVGWEDAYEQEV